MSSGFSGLRFLALAVSAAVIAAASGCLGDGTAETATPKAAVPPAYTPPPTATSTPVPTQQPHQPPHPLPLPPDWHRRLRPPPFQRRRRRYLPAPTCRCTSTSAAAVCTRAPSAGMGLLGRRSYASSPSAAATSVLSGKMGVPIAGETMRTVHRCYQRWPYPHLCVEGGRNRRRVQSSPPDDERFTTVSAGGLHTCALREDGTSAGGTTSTVSVAPGERALRVFTIRLRPFLLLGTSTFASLGTGKRRVGRDIPGPFSRSRNFGPPDGGVVNGSSPPAAGCIGPVTCAHGGG